MRILVVEDDPALRLGLRRTLEGEGWQVDVAVDGEQALAAMATPEYDAALLYLGYRGATDCRSCDAGERTAMTCPS